MPKFLAENGDDLVVEQVERAFGGARKEVLKVDGSTGQMTREGKPVLAGAALYSAVSLGSNGAGDLTIAKAVKGDSIAMAYNATDDTDASSAFESVVSVGGKIHQSSVSDLSAKKILFLLVSQA